MISSKQVIGQQFNEINIHVNSILCQFSPNSNDSIKKTDDGSHIVYLDLIFKTLLFGRKQ